MIVNKVVHGGPAFKVPGHLSFGQHVIDKLREHKALGDNVAIINGDTGVQLTYGQVLQEVVNIATGLRNLGVKRGDVVALCSENRSEFLFAATGAICCGATITTLNVLYTKDEITHVLNISKPSIIFVSEAAIKNVLSHIKSLPYVKTIIQMNGAPISSGIRAYRDVAAVNADVEAFEVTEVQGWTDTVFLLYSSGTTGLPKGVMLTHLNALYSAAGHIDRIRQDDSKLLTVVPWYHAYGLMTTFNYLMSKVYMVYLVGFNPEVYLKTVQKYKITTLIAVPPIIVFLAKNPLVEKFDTSTIKSIWCGAAPLSAETIAATKKRLTNCQHILQAYGMTETSLAVTRDDEDAKLRPGTGGCPIPGTKAKVVDPETREKLGPHQNGEVCVKGIVLMKGYAGDRAASLAVLDEEGYMKTGDIGYYDNEGYFFIVDRLKELIKYKGYQVPPAEVENVLLQHPGVAECGVVGAPNDAAGELPTAFVVLKPGVKTTEKDIIEFAASKLSRPKRLHGGVIIVKEIPKNPSGKILRRVLKQKLIELKKSKL